VAKKKTGAPAGPVNVGAVAAAYACDIANYYLKPCAKYYGAVTSTSCNNPNTGSTTGTLVVTNNCQFGEYWARVVCLA
jgi:hypothetical protein